MWESGIAYQYNFLAVKIIRFWFINRVIKKRPLKKPNYFFVEMHRLWLHFGNALDHSLTLKSGGGWGLLY